MSDQLSTEPHTILDAAGCVAVDLPCVNCRYNLRTQPVSANCPECAHPVIETLTRYLPALDHLGRIAQDLLCTSCGYNLRTLALTGACPECAAPVAQSARGRFLHLAPPRWLKRMTEGALELAIGLASPLLCYLFVIGLGVLLTSGAATAFGMTTVGIVVGVVGAWFVVAGTWRLTTPEPGSEFRHDGLTARKLARWCLLTVPLLLVAGVAVSGFRRAPLGFAFFPAASLVLVVASIACMALPLVLLRHIRTLMSRVPRPDLATFAKIEFWAVLACAAVMLVGQVAFMTFMFTAMPPAAWGTGPAMPPYAAGPNTPGTGATASAPALTSPVYTSTTVTYVGPGGTVTTAPASAPVVMTPPTFGPALGIAMFLSVASGCGMLIVGIAGFVLLILVWRALVNAARVAEQNAPPNTA